MKRAKLKHGTRIRAKTQVTLAPNLWDMGADGPANRIGLVKDERGEINPVTGKRENPNNVWGVKRETWAQRYMRAGHLSKEQWYVAVNLRDASEGRVTVDVLAAIFIDKPGGSDPQAARVDARKAFRDMMAVAPKATHPVLERVVVEDQSIWWHSGGGRVRHFERLREGLDAIYAVFFTGDRRRA